MRKLVLSLAAFVFLSGVAKAQDFIITEVNGNREFWVSEGVIRAAGYADILGRIQGNSAVFHWEDSPDMVISLATRGLYPFHRPANHTYIVDCRGDIFGIFRGTRVYIYSCFVGILWGDTLTIPRDEQDALVFRIMHVNRLPSGYDRIHRIFVRFLALFLIFETEEI